MEKKEKRISKQSMLFLFLITQLPCAEVHPGTGTLCEHVELQYPTLQPDAEQQF